MPRIELFQRFRSGQIVYKPRVLHSVENQCDCLCQPTIHSCINFLYWFIWIAFRILYNWYCTYSNPSLRKLIINQHCARMIIKSVCAIMEFCFQFWFTSSRYDIQSWMSQTNRWNEFKMSAKSSLGNLYKNLISANLGNVIKCIKFRNHPTRLDLN